MLLGGLWHGASWTFVVWGGLHGLYLIVERLIRKPPAEKIETPKEAYAMANATVIPGIVPGRKSNSFLLALLTFMLINITWVFFRANDFSTAWRLLGAMFGFIPNGLTVLSNLDLLKVFGVMIPLVIIHWRMRNTTVGKWVERIPSKFAIAIWVLMILALLLAQETGDAFLYFQF
jgi:alginate O-acetyltransferase complex protein AlgI